MTPCEKLGYKVGDRFKAGENGAAGFSAGTEIILIEDDGTNRPNFRHAERSTFEQFCLLREIKPLNITLRPGDYVSTEGMTENDYHTVAAAFMAAGAGSGEYPEWEYADRGYLHGFGWSDDGELFHGDFKRGIGYWHRHGKRHLSIPQVLSATNAGRDIKTQKEPTTMHLTDLLYQARKERDEAQARYEQVLADHRATYPWLAVEENAQPAEDMSDPENWKAGDVVEYIGDEASYFTIGKEYKLMCISSGFFIIDDDGDEMRSVLDQDAARVKWVRRP